MTEDQKQFLFKLKAILPAAQAPFWPSRQPCIGPFSAEEWDELHGLLQAVDSLFLGSMNWLALARQGLETSGEVPEEALRGMLEIADMAFPAAEVMARIHELMGRFALVTMPAGSMAPQGPGKGRLQ